MVHEFEELVSSERRGKIEGVISLGEHQTSSKRGRSFENILSKLPGTLLVILKNCELEILSSSNYLKGMKINEI